MIILASKSPRRKELLAQLGVEFICQSADIDETVLSNETPYNYVERLAIEKAKSIFVIQKNNSAMVIGSDTAVIINNEILGKPVNKKDSARILNLLSNNSHEVLTSIALITHNVVKTKVVTTQVNFKTLTANEIEAYWYTKEPQDKAGSYGIQGIGGQFVRSINGSYSAVVGLPLYEMASLLNEAGIATIKPLGIN